MKSYTLLWFILKALNFEIYICTRKAVISENGNKYIFHQIDFILESDITHRFEYMDDTISCLKVVSGEHLANFTLKSGERYRNIHRVLQRMNV